jgi:hypothetical protein
MPTNSGVRGRMVPIAERNFGLTSRGSSDSVLADANTTHQETVIFIKPDDNYSQVVTIGQ